MSGSLNKAEAFRKYIFAPGTTFIIQIHALQAVEQPALRSDEYLYAAHLPSQAIISLPRRKNPALLNSQG
jgi:hypothetical protein